MPNRTHRSGGAVDHGVAGGSPVLKSSALRSATTAFATTADLGRRRPDGIGQARAALPPVAFPKSSSASPTDTAREGGIGANGAGARISDTSRLRIWVVT